MRLFLIVTLCLLAGCNSTFEQPPQQNLKLKGIIRDTRVQLEVGYETLKIVHKAQKMKAQQRYYYVGKRVYEYTKEASLKSGYWTAE